jgi:hypothetical protein
MYLFIYLLTKETALRTVRRPLALRSVVGFFLALAFSLNAAAQTSQWNAVPATTVNSTQINFAEHEWVVIGNAGKDIYTNGTYGSASQPSNSVTLLLKSGDAGGGFGNSVFRAFGSTCSGSYAGSCTCPNDYNDSTLQQKMAGIANGLPDKEQKLINARDLEPVTGGAAANLAALNQGDGINGAAVNGQKLWALSYPEWNAIGDNTVRSYPSSWRLRSPDDYSVTYNLIGGANGSGGSSYTSSVGYAALAVRPAFNLGLTSVLFASDASSIPSALERTKRPESLRTIPLDASGRRQRRTEHRRNGEIQSHRVAKNPAGHEVALHVQPTNQRVPRRGLGTRIRRQGKRQHLRLQAGHAGIERRYGDGGSRPDPDPERGKTGFGAGFGGAGVWRETGRGDGEFQGKVSVLERFWFKP